MINTQIEPLPSWLPPGGQNRFQLVKAVRSAAEASGIKLVNLGVGQPLGAPLRVTREAIAAAVMREAQSMHEYQDNGEDGCPGFSQAFVQAHCTTSLRSVPAGQIGFCPIPGIKPILMYVIFACGASDTNRINVVTCTNPGYPTPADACRLLYPLVNLQEPELSSQNDFRFTIADINHLQRGDLLMVNYPQNPCGQIMTKDDWRKLCSFCAERGVRLFNDGAYSILAHSLEHCTLADVAVGFKKLSWMEAFSASKISNMTGHRIGAVVGSADFVADFKTVKGNLDSGAPAFVMHGALAAFTDDREGIVKVQQMYQGRLELLTNTLIETGMHLAVEPKAGFFSIWKTPASAFGQKVLGAQHFNELMIKPLEGSGVIGVHFPPYIRYAVCADIAPQIAQIRMTFTRASVQY